MYKKYSFIILAIFILCPAIVAAQGLSVSSVSIENQSVNVDTAVTISVTFNKSLKTYKPGFDFGKEGVIGLVPITTKVSNLSISGATISADVILKPNTTYQVIVANRFLQGTDGSTLSELITFVSTFSTGAALDLGSISGTITPAVDLSEIPAFVGCFLGSVKETNFIRGAAVASDGSYTIGNLPAGTYVVYAAQDVTMSMNIESLNYGMISAVTLTEGQAKTDVNFEIPSFNVTSITPADGTVGVDNSTTITIVFDSPVNTETVVYEVVPEPISQGETVWSNNNTTLSIPVTFNSNRNYGVGVAFAVSEAGQGLSSIAQAIFSTGDTPLPTGSISGKVTNPNGSASYTVVGTANEDGDIVSGVMVDYDGSYTIKYLPEGDYIVGAVTFDEKISPFEENSLPKSISKVGFLSEDREGDEEDGLYHETLVAYHGWDVLNYSVPPTAVTVGTGTVENIDMTLGNKTVMELLSTSPADGAVGVATDLSQLSLTFNLPFRKPTNAIEREIFYSRNIEFVKTHMNIGFTEPPMPVFSDNGRTITFTTPTGFSLEENKMYNVAFLAAIDAVGLEIKPENFVSGGPEVVSFTTGSSLPTTTVSGEIVFRGFVPKWAVAAFLDRDPSLGTNAIVLGGVPVNLADGSYSAILPNGSYYPVVVSGTSFLPIEQMGESITDRFYGGYDSNGDHVTDRITVSDASLTGIDMVVSGTKSKLTLAGNVKGSDGVTMSDASIVLRYWIDEQNYQDTYASAGYDGRFLISDLDLGEYTISVYPEEKQQPNYSSKQMSLNLKYDVNIKIVLNKIEKHFSYVKTGVDSIVAEVSYVKFTNPKEPMNVSQADEIAILTGDGIVCGAIKIVQGESSPFKITAWADDPATAEKDGYLTGDEIEFKYFRQASNREYSVEIDNYTTTPYFGDVLTAFGLEKEFIQINQEIVKTVEPDSSVKLDFEDESSIEIKFTSGDVADKEITVKFLGSSSATSSQDTLEQLPVIAAVGVYTVDAPEIEADAFSAVLSFGYTDALLAEANLVETDIVLAYFDPDSDGGIWISYPRTVVDTVNKVAKAEVNHFSVWIITDTHQENLVTDIEDEQNENRIPDEFILNQNYPNPFNAETIIKYQIPKFSKVTLKIYNLMGQEVATLLDNEVKQAGFHTEKWNGINKFNIPVSSGIYFYVLTADRFISAKKMVYLK